MIVKYSTSRHGVKKPAVDPIVELRGNATAGVNGAKSPDAL